eukprot:184026_1
MVLLFLCFCSIFVVKAAYWTQGTNAVLSVDLTNIDSYSISIQNETWLIGTEPNLWCNSHWYSTTNNIYLLNPQTTSPVQTKGNDINLGLWVGLEMIYKLSSSDTICNGKTMVILFQYFNNDDFFLFTQSFPNGLINTNIKQLMNPPTDPHGVMIPLSEFPSFNYSNSSMLRNKLGYIEWRGRFMHDTSSHGVGLNNFGGGNEGGPIVLFKDGIKPTSALVFSAASNFMNGIFAIRTRRSRQENIMNCSFIENTDFMGEDIEVIQNVNSVQDCCSLCDNNEYCNVFTYIPNQSGYSKNCYFKYNDRFKQISGYGHISGYVGSNGDNGNLDCLVSGIEGNLTFIPANYSISFIISALENKGIHGAMYKWGDILQKKYQTTKLDPSTDLTVSTLGYYTQNGGYFYGGNPLTTSTATKLFEAFVINEIPVGYLQLDPYWYMGGSNTNNGFIWIPRTDLFPNGLTDLYNKIGKIPLLLYSSYWTANKTQNYYNSNYNLSLQFSNSLTFDVGWLQGPIAEPIGYESSYNFYRFIISQYSEIMMGFEVDFMNWEYDNFPVFTNGYNTMTNLSEQWTKGMQDALFEYNFSVQYCMDLPSYVLQSLQYPAVTNARATTDNFPGDKMRWKIAYTNLLLSPLSIRPFFDVIWTTSYQPGNVYNVNETDCEMEAIIASLCGPVGIGDNINQTNKTIINRIVRKDGILLQPTNALTPIDAMYSSISSFRPSGEIWMTCTSIMDNIEGYNVFAVDVFLSEYKLSFLDLYPIPNIDDKFYFYLFDDSNDNVSGQCMNNTNIKECDLRILNNSQTLNIITSAPPQNNPYHLHSWNLYNLVRIQSNGWSLLGEMNKYSNISPQRFKSIQLNINPKGMSVVVKGAPNEVITITFITDKSNILQITVNFNENGDDQTIVVS